MVRLLVIVFLCSAYVSFKIYRAFFSPFKLYFVIPIIFLLLDSFFIVTIYSWVTGAYIPNSLINVTCVFMGILVYFIFYFILFDFLWLIGLRFTIFGQFAGGAAVFILTLITFSYGLYHKSDTKVKYYDVAIDKPLKESVRIALISDLHIGSGMTVERLHKYVYDINKLNPDMVIIAGDIIDHDIRSFSQDFRAPLRGLTPPMGTYAVLGNHEYYSGDIDKITRAIQSAGITVLKDETVFFKDKGFYLVGRDSLRHSNSEGGERLPASELMKQYDSSLPVIMIDHVPRSIKDGKLMNVDLQLSGHTHGGQFFPVTRIVKYMYPIASGFLKDGSFNLIVTSGLGLWGPPMRIGSDSEILLITVAGRKNYIPEKPAPIQEKKEESETTSGAMSSSEDNNDNETNEEESGETEEQIYTPPE